MKHCYHLLLLFVSLLYFVSAAQCQSTSITGTISGKLTNETAEPFRYITITLCRAADSIPIKGAITKEDGSFMFKDLPAGDYRLMIDAPGFYRSFHGIYSIDSAGIVLKLLIVLPPSPDRQLRTVDIISRKALVEKQGNKTVLNVAGSVMAAGNSALSILSKAPGVSVDNDGNISLRGKGGVNVMIDNKPTYLPAAQLAALLRATDGSTIQTIELMTNPSAKYDAAGSAGIINIRLKKNNNQGTNGTVTVGGGYGKYYKANTGLALNHRTKNINIFGNYNYVNDKEFEDLNVSRSTVADHIATYFDQQGKQQYLRKNNNYKAGIDYYLGENNVIGFLLSGYSNTVDLKDNITTSIGHQPPGVDSTVIAHNLGKSSYVNQTYNLNYKTTIDTMGRQLNADIDYSRFRNDNNITYSNNFYNATGSISKMPLIFRNISPSQIHILAGKIDYSSPVGPTIKLETGLKSSYVNTDNDFQSDNFNNNEWVQNSAMSNRFTYTEQVHAAYINLEKQFHHTKIQLGLRSELTRSEGNSLTLQQMVKRSYLDLFPNLSLNKELSPNHEIGFSYSRRIDRPDYQSLNPFIYFADLYTFSQGNPMLKPQYANVYEFSYGHQKKTNITLGYTHTKDVITTTLITDTLKKTLLLYEDNLSSRDTWTANINRPLSINSWWNTSNDASLYHSRFSSADLMGEKFSSGKLTWMINTVHTFVLDPDFSAELSGNYTSSQVYGTYVIKPLYSVDFGISKTFADKKANLKMAVSDMFNWRKAQISSAVPSQDYTLSQKQESRILRLTFTYNFGSTLVKAVRERLNGNSAEQSRVKSGG